MTLFVVHQHVRWQPWKMCFSLLIRSMFTTPPKLKLPIWVRKEWRQLHSVVRPSYFRTIKSWQHDHSNTFVEAWAPKIVRRTACGKECCGSRTLTKTKLNCTYRNYNYFESESTVETQGELSGKKTADPCIRHHVQHLTQLCTNQRSICHQWLLCCAAEPQGRFCNGLGMNFFC